MRPYWGSYVNFQSRCLWSWDSQTHRVRHRHAASHSDPCITPTPLCLQPATVPQQTSKWQGRIAMHFYTYNKHKTHAGLLFVQTQPLKVNVFHSEICDSCIFITSKSVLYCFWPKFFASHQKKGRVQCDLQKKMLQSLRKNQARMSFWVGKEVTF